MAKARKIAKLMAGGMSKKKAKEVAKPTTKGQKKSAKGFGKKTSMRGVGALNRKLSGVGEG